MTLVRYPLLVTLYRSQGCQLVSFAVNANLHYLYYTIVSYTILHTYCFIFYQFHLHPIKCLSHVYQPYFLYPHL